LVPALNSCQNKDFPAVIYNLLLDYRQNPLPLAHSRNLHSPNKHAFCASEQVARSNGKDVMGFKDKKWGKPLSMLNSINLLSIK